MNRMDVVYKLAAKLGVKPSQSRDFLLAFEEVLTEALQEDETIGFHGFGSFAPWKQVERPGRNPRNGTPYQIAPRVSVKFKPGKFLLNTLNEQKK